MEDLGKVCTIYWCEEDKSRKTILFAYRKLNKREEQGVNLLLVKERILNHVNMESSVKRKLCSKPSHYIQKVSQDSRHGRCTRITISNLLSSTTPMGA